LLRSFLGISLALALLLGNPLHADGLYPQSIKAYKKRVKSIDYGRFFSEEQNFYFARPKLIETIFFGLVDLKGNPKVARYHIKAKVLGCPENEQLVTKCIINRYYHEKRTLKIPNRFDFGVNFTRINRKRTPGKTDRLALSWRQQTFETPVIGVDDFFDMVGAAKESKYYKIKPQVKQIVFNVQLENHFEVILPDRLMRDLVSLYTPIPQDGKDRIYYKIIGSDLSLEENLASANLRLKAEKVLINHRLINATEDPIRATK